MDWQAWSQFARCVVTNPWTWTVVKLWIFVLHCILTSQLNIARFNLSFSRKQFEKTQICSSHNHKRLNSAADNSEMRLTKLRFSALSVATGIVQTYYAKVPDNHFLALMGDHSKIHLFAENSTPRPKISRKLCIRHRWKWDGETHLQVTLHPAKAWISDDAALLVTIVRPQMFCSLDLNFFLFAEFCSRVCQNVTDTVVWDMNHFERSHWRNI